MFIVNLLIIIADFDVSGNPPLLVIIGADPLLQASKLARPNGSSHLEHITDILVFSSCFKIKLCSLKPYLIKFLCSKKCFSLGSSPIIIAFQFLYLSKILTIECPKISNPLALLSLPIKEIIFSFFLKFIFFLSTD